PAGTNIAEPNWLEATLRELLPGVTVKVTTYVRARETAPEMEAKLPRIISESAPALVIWQTGTADAIRGVDPDEFRAALDDGVDKLRAADTDVVFMNMQYSPRTEAMLAVAAYADAMRFVSLKREAVLFDRFTIMRRWNESGVFDLYGATRTTNVAERVHDCLGRLLADVIVAGAELAPVVSRGTDCAVSNRPRFLAHFAVAAVVATGLCVPLSARADEPTYACSDNAHLGHLSAPLARMRRLIAAGRPVTIMALGSSSTAGAGASTPAASYPARLEAELRSRFPRVAITVLNRGVNGEEAADMLARFDQAAADDKPDVVLWQVGTNAVLRDNPIGPVDQLILDGPAPMNAPRAHLVII